MSKNSILTPSLFRGLRRKTAGRRTGTVGLIEPTFYSSVLLRGPGCFKTSSRSRDAARHPLNRQTSIRRVPASWPMAYPSSLPPPISVHLCPSVVSPPSDESPAHRHSGRTIGPGPQRSSMFFHRLLMREPVIECRVRCMPRQARAHSLRWMVNVWNCSLAAGRLSNCSVVRIDLSCSV